MLVTRAVLRGTTATAVDTPAYHPQFAGRMNSQSTPSAPSRFERATRFADDSRWTWLLFLGLFLSVVALTVTYELEPRSESHVSEPFMWTDRERDLALVFCLIVGALGTGAYAFLRRRSWHQLRWVRVGLATVLAALTWGSGLVYFYGANGARHSFPHVHDTYHYLLGSKYFDELGYDRLYNCTAQVMGPRVIPDDTSARDLSSDRHVTARELRAAEDCRAFFSDARWEQFESDLQTFNAIERRLLRGAIGDRGYNGSPFHTFVAGTLANALPLDYQTLSLLPLIDTFSICVMLAAICQAFGYRLGLLCALLFFSQFVDRFTIIGGSFLRYQWLAALGLSLVFLKRERFVAAGAALAVSAALNVFPILFSAAMLIQGAIALIKRRPTEKYRRFLVGAIPAGLLCLALGAGHAEGLGNYARFAEAMKVHNAAGRAPGFGVGLKYNFIASSFDSGHSAKQRTRELKAMRPWIIASAALLLLAVVGLVPRLDPIEGAVLCGFSGLFCIFGPTGYYFTCAAVLLLLWHRKLWDAGGWTMVSLAFLASLPPYIAILNGAQRFHAFNRMMSASWTVYLVVALALLHWSTRRSSGGLKASRR